VYFSAKSWFLKYKYIYIYTHIYRDADKSLARPGRKQANVSVRLAWISFGALPRKKKNLITARVSMLLKSRASVTCFRACFLLGRAKDLSAPRYVQRQVKATQIRDVSGKKLASSFFRIDQEHCQITNGYGDLRLEGITVLWEFQISQMSVLLAYIHCVYYTGCLRRNSKYFRRWQYGLFRVNKLI
jgi:hypothetical protein